MQAFWRRTFLVWMGMVIAGMAFTYAVFNRGRTPEVAGDRLPALGAVLDQTSVSGISSGAYMAGQFEMAHAKIVTGAAIIAGGPYGCSESIFADAMGGPGTAFLNLSKAVNGCMLDNLSAWGVGDPEKLAEKARDRASAGKIDPIADVVTDRVYLFSGTADYTVVPAIVHRAETFYEKLGVPKSNIEFIDTMNAGHAFVTEDQGSSCAHSGTPYVVDCDYDQAGALLRHIYGNLAPPATALTGIFLEFDQRPFENPNHPNGLADTGIVYVPKHCETTPGCRIHIAFHGCAQNRELVGNAFINETGFSRWADTNNLIILFPQVGTTVANPQGCWDWWGYTGNDYLTRTAPQISAVFAMLEALHRTPQS